MLADQCEGEEFTAFTEEDLLSYYNDALCQILALRPDAFAEVTEIKLTEGECQKLSDEFHQLLNIIGAEKAPDSDTVQSSDELMSHFRRKSCPSGAASGPYAAKTFTVNAATKVDFIVDPPVPSGQTPVVKATVVRAPAMAETKDLDAPSCLGHEYNAILCDWMLHRAYSAETENAENRSWAEFHYQKFYNTFTTNYLQGQRFGSGFYLGREGDGDGSFRGR